jgi:DNA-binding LytR/AlgR family response regulator
VRVLIVDDEQAARERLTALLEELDVEIAGEAVDGVDALAKARALQPDVVLLDIVMPEIDGFDVARHLPEPRALVIFQTAFSHHALKAFEHEAVDYVVKPVTRARLQQALDRARRRLGERASREVSPSLLARLEAALGQGRTPRRTRLLVRQGAGHRALPIRDVIRFVADEGLVFACTAGARALTDYTLTELEQRLSGGFIRASRSDLVQIDRIERVVSNGDGSSTLTLTDGATVHVSRRRSADVRRALQ